MPQALSLTLITSVAFLQVRERKQFPNLKASKKREVGVTGQTKMSRVVTSI